MSSARARSKEIPSPPSPSPLPIKTRVPHSDPVTAQPSRKLQPPEQKLLTASSMTISGLICTLASVLARAAKRCQRRLIARGASFISSKKKTSRKGGKKVGDQAIEEVWRRTIIMGGKCDPLDFSGAVHYDSEGNRVSGPPDKSPFRSPLHVFLLRLETAAIHPVAVSDKWKIPGLHSSFNPLISGGQYMETIGSWN